MKISNIKYQISSTRSGYSLIELLIVMVVLLTVGYIVATILVSSLRGTTKAVTTETVRKNGNYTIQQISKMIEFAQSFVGVSNDNATYSTSCPGASPSPEYKYIKIKSFDNLETTFSCFTSPNAPIASNGASFIDTSQIEVSQCYFTCTRSNLSASAAIGINFTLSQKTSSNFFEKKATIPFQTSVLIRNLNK